MSCILILTASPVRDLIIDTLLAEELIKKGHQVSIRPCLREGRDAVLEVRPDVVVMPPIRNPYSRDMIEVLKGWGIGVVSRHTEPSCDWPDFKKMTRKQQADIHGVYPYVIDAEIVWSQDEAQILNKPNRLSPFQTHAVGAFTVDPYLRPDLVEKHKDCATFCKKYGFDEGKKILLICSAWGFVDSSPDLHISEVDSAKGDIAARDRHFDMIRTLDKKLDEWNILVSVHPGVFQPPYKELCDELKIPLDVETASFDLKVNVDAFVHAGSTMAIGAHLLGKPAWQFGDINAKDCESWWNDPESPISKVSPYCKTPDELVAAIDAYTPTSNASSEALEALEKGRFGVMDGQATVRAAEVIDKVKGRFQVSWPGSTRDYTQLTILRELRQLITPMGCAICKKEFVIVNESYFEKVKVYINQVLDTSDLDKGVLDEVKKLMLQIPFRAAYGNACPWCSARFTVKEMAQ